MIGTRRVLRHGSVWVACFGVYMATVAIFSAMACEHNMLVDIHQLHAARSLWRSHKLQDYDIKQEHQCFCIYPSGFVTVMVRAGKVVDAIDQQGVPVSQEKLQYYKTVDRLFDWIEGMQKQKPDRFDVVFDSAFGFPSEIVLDQSTRAVDDELTIKLKDLQTTVARPRRIVR